MPSLPRLPGWLPVTQDRAKQVLKSVKERVDGDPVMVAKLSRVSGATYLFIEVAAEIEELFTTSRVNESSQWSDGDDHHAFYQQEYTGELLDLMEGHYDDYGREIINDQGQINKAVFRTAGLSEGKTFKIDGPFSETSLKEGVQELRQFAEQLHDTFLSTTILVSELKHVDIASTATTGGA